ncbi:apolipoprotein N-acyltransferase [Avibacterium sp. 20-129]|uniref:apolipoprotein N-acyltransferase n=1 Tax=Avibacterium sp. 20-129 TaxID=2911525 RepID=UPI00224757FE|nr:apolipoprotein N-acyltransferase [Avibacterium sp. 20-129]MCW9698572.1 apolipoprotein N-acyltransferase [Avibacterium sp. 20-129]
MKSQLIYLIALLSGGLGVFAFSPFDFWGLAYLSLLGLLWVAKTAKKSTALCGAFLWGLSFFSFGVNWLHVSIHQFGGSPLWLSYVLVVLLAAYLALFPTLFAYFIQRFKVNNLALYPVLWTFTEFLRGWLFTGFPWLQLGYTQIDSPFSGLAPIFGVQGLTFFVMWVSAVLFSLISHLLQKDKKWLMIASQSVLCLIISGLAMWPSSANYVQEKPEKALTITLVQGNIEQNLKWEPHYLSQTLGIYGRLIAQYLGKTDLIILPEAALPTLENDIQRFLLSLQQATKDTGTQVMIGTIYQDWQKGKLFNSIINLGDPDLPYSEQTHNRYNKHHLVPFGEYVPLENLLRPLGSVFNLPMSAFQSGEEVQKPFLAKQRKFTPAICYEIIFGSQVQKNLNVETDFLLTISNDAWFGNSIGPWQHLQMARMRALEFGKPEIRATNTGITAFINAKGEVIAQAPQFVETTLTQRIAPTVGKTPYAQLGDMPLYFLCFLLMLLRGVNLLLWRILKRTAV